MSYTERLTITIPVGLYEVACAISRALDPDVGGDKSWMSLDENTYITSTPCTAEFKQQALYMLTTPEALFSVVEADYKARWNTLEPPTLEQCTAFCASVQVIEEEPDSHGL